MNTLHSRLRAQNVNSGPFFHSGKGEKSLFLLYVMLISSVF